MPIVPQDALETTVSIHRATLGQTLNLYCNRPTRQDATSTEEEPCSEKDLEEAHQDADYLYTVNQIVRHASLGPRLRYVERWDGYSGADDTAEPPYSIQQHFPDVY